MNDPTLAQALERGLAWLYTDAHPAGSQVFHLGASLACRHNRTLSFVPGRSHERGGAVIVLEVTRPVRRTGSRPYPSMVPLAPDELDRLERLLAQRGYSVTHRWNGFPATTGSLELAQPISSAMYAARTRYSQGCPLHPARSVFCSCPQWRAAYDLLIPLKPKGHPSTWTPSTTAN